MNATIAKLLRLHSAESRLTRPQYRKAKRGYTALTAAEKRNTRLGLAALVSPVIAAPRAPRLMDTPTNAREILAAISSADIGQPGWLENVFLRNPIVPDFWRGYFSCLVYGMHELDVSDLESQQGRKEDIYNAAAWCFAPL